MAQSTTAASFTQLKPIQNTNTGAIILQQLNFLKRNKSIDDARNQSNKLRQQQFARQANKDFLTKIEGLSGQDAKGYFTEEVLNYKEKNRDKFLQVSKACSRGDERACILWQQEKEKLSNIINASKVVEQKTKELSALKASGQFNAARDQELEDFVNQLAKSNYALDPSTGTFRVYDPKNANILLEIDPKRLSNDFLNSTFHNPVKFGDVGFEISKNIKLDTVDGQKLISAENKRTAVSNVSDSFKADPNLFITYALDQGIDKPISEFTELEFNSLATKFANENVLNNLAETTKDTTISDEKARIQLASARQELINKRLTAEGKRIDIAKKGTVDGKSGLRTLVDGILSGDPTSVESLVDQKLEEQGSGGADIFIREAEFSNGKIIIKKSNNKITEIDTNQQNALGKVLELTRPNDKIDKRLEEYNAGTPTEFTKVEPTGEISNIEFNKIFDKFPKTESKAIERLEKNGITGFTQRDVLSGSTIASPEGEIFDIGTKEGKEKLQQFIKNKTSTPKGRFD